MSFPIPVLLIGFNRPAFTQKVLDVLRQIRPARLYVACDGPRLEHSSDQERCQQVRRMCAPSPEGLVDWHCQVFYRVSEVNQGCRANVVGALDWIFDNEEAAIILEDDIVPDPSFFPYCEQLLERYRLDTRIGCIAANAHQRMPLRGGSSYRFSIYTHCWGWATWKRAWMNYDRDLEGWPSFRDQGWMRQLGTAKFSKTWTAWLNQLAHKPNRSIWDMIWQFSCWQQGYLTIIPEVELVENIGFGRDATHTLDEHSPLTKRSAMAFPLRHPVVIRADHDLDVDTFRRMYARGPFFELKRKSLKALRLLGFR